MFTVCWCSDSEFSYINTDCIATCQQSSMISMHIVHAIIACVMTAVYRKANVSLLNSHA